MRDDSDETAARETRTQSAVARANTLDTIP